MTFEIDRTSLLVGVPGAATLASIERSISSEGFTLGMGAAGTDTTVADWIGAGAPGAPMPFADPADHLLAGLTATLINGKRLEIRPSPRRAVGPDLMALFMGANERFGSIDHVWLRVHRKDAQRVSLPIDAALVDLDPPVSREEASLIDAIALGLMRSS